MKKHLSLALILAVILSVNASAAVNLAQTADEVTTSTSYNEDYSGEAARDGIVRGEEFTLHQWITDYESEADLTLTWSSPVTVNKAVFYDRVSETDNVISGTITFSDGTVVEFGELEPTGLPTEVAFDEITTTSAVIHVVGDDITMSVGLDEVEFYTPDNVNVAMDATATATSVMADGTDNEERAASWYPENYTDWYAARKAINGYANANLPEGAEYEWASQGEPNPTITFSWFPAVKIGTIVLYDRINTNDHVIGGTIEFSDGTELEFDEIPNDGAPYYIDVNDIEADSFTIYTYTEGPNPGFAEVEVYTEHFVDGKPVGGAEAEAAETVPAETEPAEAVEEKPAETEELESQPAEPEAAAEIPAEPEAPKLAEPAPAEPKEAATAPQTFDAAAVFGITALISAAAAYISKKNK